MLTDIYVLASERTASLVERFLARFIPLRERAEADYTAWLGGERIVEFDTPDRLIAFCESQPNADARAYWNNCTGDDPRSAHIFFLSDGGLVLGLSVAADDQRPWEQWLSEMQLFAGAKYGYWTAESPPENSTSEFVAVAEKASRT